MILVDTSVWVDHLRAQDPQLSALLLANGALVHPFVIGELMMGNLPDRVAWLEALRGLPHVVAAHDDEVVGYIGRESLFGLGIGYVDAHLLAATRLTSGALFWTRDKRLLAAAIRLGIAAHLPN